jgi:hypothetical protein
MCFFDVNYPEGRVKNVCGYEATDPDTDKTLVKSVEKIREDTRYRCPRIRSARRYRLTVREAVPMIE